MTGIEWNTSDSGPCWLC